MREGQGPVADAGAAPAGAKIDLARSLWPRVTSARQRTGLIVLGFSVLLVAIVWSGSRWEPSSVAPATRPAQVVVFGAPRLGWQDIGTGAMPNLDRLAARGAVAATNVRTSGRRPSTVEGYATLGAGTRVGAETRDSGAGALRHALRSAGLRIAVVGNADTGVARSGRRSILRPAAVAVMDSRGSVGFGGVGPSVSTADATAPFGMKADATAVMAAVRSSLARADVVVVDSGDLDRAADFAAASTTAQAGRARRNALAATDSLLGEVSAALGQEGLLLVVSVAPPDDRWRLTPMVASGAGVYPGYLHSPSTRRLGVVTLADVAPTILASLGASVPDGMIGHPLRYHPGSPDLEWLRRMDRDAAVREDIYLPLTISYIVAQALVYLVAAVALCRPGGAGRAAPWLRRSVLAVCAWPLATFVLRAIPDVGALEGGAVPLLLLIDAGIVALALRARRRPLSPLAWVCGATVALIVVDVATGARLQTSSLLGYSLHTAARFSGLGNTAFAVLAAATIVAVGLHVRHAPRRQEALVTAACVFVVVIVTDGAPGLGSDVGGILTLVPVFGLTLLALSGRRLSWKAVGVAVAMTLAIVATATGIDLLRPPTSRTHLGTLVARVAEDGWEPLTSTVNRKLAANLRSRSSWTWTAPILALYMLYVLGPLRGWSRLLPPRSPVRVAVGGTLAAGLLGFAVNDSGAVVTALVFVYVGPLLALHALEREQGALAPRPAPAAVPARPARRARAPVPAALPGGVR